MASGSATLALKIAVMALVMAVLVVPSTGRCRSAPPPPAPSPPPPPPPALPAPAPAPGPSPPVLCSDCFSECYRPCWDSNVQRCGKYCDFGATAILCKDKCSKKCIAANCIEK